MIYFRMFRFMWDPIVFLVLVLVIHLTAGHVQHIAERCAAQVPQVSTTTAEGVPQEDRAIAHRGI